MKICVDDIKVYELPALQMSLTASFGVQTFEIAKESEAVYLKIR